MSSITEEQKEQLLALMNFTKGIMAINQEVMNELEDMKYDLQRICIDKTKIKVFDKVLVRNGDNSKWEPAFFKSYETHRKDFFYLAMDDSAWKQCILYEGNEDLIWTTNSPTKK